MDKLGRGADLPEEGVVQPADNREILWVSQTGVAGLKRGHSPKQVGDQVLRKLQMEDMAFLQVMVLLGLCRGINCLVHDPPRHRQPCVDCKSLWFPFCGGHRKVITRLRLKEEQVGILGWGRLRQMSSCPQC